MTKNKDNDYKKGVISLVLLSVVFASMGLFARFLSTSFLLYQQVYLRMLFAFVVAFVAFWPSLDFAKLKRVPSKDWLFIFLRAASYSLFGITLFTQALILTKYSNVSFIGALPTTAILGFLFLKEKVTLKKVLYLALSFVGILIVSVTDFGHIFGWGIGEILTLVSTFFFSFSYISRKWMSPLLNNQELTVLNFLFCFLIVLLVSLTKGDGIPITGFSPSILLALLGAGIFNILNVYLTNYGFQKVEAVLASNILTLETFFAVILGFLFYKEIPFAKDILGGFIIILSVILMNNLEAKKTQ